MDSSAVQTWALLILLAPLAGAIAAGVLGPGVLKGRSHWPVILGVGAAVLGAFKLFGLVRHGAHEGAHSVTVVLYQWFAAYEGKWFNVEVLVDPLTVIMLLVVTGVSLLVIIYSRDYMREDGQAVKGYERFFAYLGLFVFSMVALVLGGNFLLLYLGWEAVGLCSFLLIGFYYDKPAAAAAAKKAFLVNRIGDFGFGLGILLIYLTFGSLDFATVFDMAERGVAVSGDLSYGRVTAIALLLLCGAVGKSAQLPLHVWLPDAMEGPSPVSALIHAATMVTAGVYMIVRCGSIFAASPLAMTIVALIGGLTALFAASIALVQYDMKRILAYSTISQLGYMFLGLGVSAAGSAVFHLYTHAFFKALLFLAAGSVMHAMGGIIDIRKFGGLRRVLPWTYRTMFLGCLALAGFPLLSGFWSKDEIIHAAFTQDKFLGGLALLTAVMTAFYTFRMFFRAFFGTTRVPEGVHAHESGLWMLVPLFVLSIGAVFAGFVGVEVGHGGMLGLFRPHGAFHHFLEPVLTPFTHGGHEAHATLGHFQEFGLMYASAALSVFGIAVAYTLYVDSPMLAMIMRRVFPATHELLLNKYHVDEGYDRFIVRPLRSLGRFCAAIDEHLIDGLVWLVTAVPRLIGMLLRSIQQGSLQGYAASMMVGLAVLLAFVLWGVIS